MTPFFQTFYVTLDLSSYAVPARNAPKSEKAPPVTDPPPATQPTQNTDPSLANLDPRLAPPAADTHASSAHAAIQAEEENEEPGPDAVASSHHQQQQQQPQEPGEPGEPASADHIQILELHSRNPLISYQSQLYSCEWTSTLGTDVLLAANQTDRLGTRGGGQEAESAEALRSFPGVDLVATSRIKLTARPVQAAPHPREPIAAATTAIATITATAPPTAPLTTTTMMPSKLAEPMSLTTQTSDSSLPNPVPVIATAGGPTTLIQLPVEESATPQRQNQAAFLSRLMNIKRAKGEADEVIVTVSPLQELRRRGLATPNNRGRGRSGRRGRRAGRARASGRGGMGTDNGDNNGDTGHYVVHPSESRLRESQEHTQGQGYEERPLVDPELVDAPMVDPHGVDGGACDIGMQRHDDDTEMRNT